MKRKVKSADNIIGRLHDIVLSNEWTLSRVSRLSMILQSLFQAKGAILCRLNRFFSTWFFFSSRHFYTPLHGQIYCMRNPDGTPKGCAFVKFSTRSAAIAAIEALHEKCTMDVSVFLLQVPVAHTLSQLSWCRLGESAPALTYDWTLTHSSACGLLVMMKNYCCAYGFCSHLLSLGMV